MNKLFRLTVILYVSFSINIFAQMFGQEPSERQRTYDVQHIKIEIGVNIWEKKISGNVSTTIVPLTDEFSSFEVDAVGMNIFVVSVEGKSSKYEYENNKIKIYLDKLYKKTDTIYYSISYMVNNPEKGLYFISPTTTFPNKRYEVWSQGEGEDNRYWFPCYDYPNDMATTEMIVTVDYKYQTISNGVLKSRKENHNETSTWHWVNDKPHVSYLVMLGIGNWDVIEDSWEGIPVLSYVPPGKKEWGERSYRKTTDILKFFSEYIGYKYPWGKFSQVAVQDFIYGGMENTGAVVLFEGSVYDEKTEPDYNATNLVAHELAHQWWGDVVTCQNWNEIWLNESFATYFQCLYTEHNLGKDEFDYNIFRNGNDAIKADSTTARKQIYNREGLTVNTYDKGSVVLNMLRNLVGDEKFRKTMNIYITKNAHKPVVTKNLVNALYEAMDNPLTDRMPPDMTWFFEEWIYKAGQPEIEASYSYNEDTKELVLKTRQVQRPDSSSEFRTEFPVQVITENGVTETSIRTTYLQGEYRIKLDSKPRCVIFNSGNKVLSRLYFTKPKEDWLYQLNNSQDAIDRITAITGLKDFINDKDVVEALLERAKNDKFWGVRSEAAKMLANSKNKIAEDNYFKFLIAEPDSRVRKTYITGIVTMIENNPVNSPNTQGILETFLLELAKNETSYFCTAEAITTLSKVMPKDRIYDMVIPFEDMDSHTDIIRRSVFAALDLSDDPRSLHTLLEYAKIGSTARVRNAAISGLDNFLDNPEVIDFLNKKVLEKTRSTQSVILGLLEKAKNPSSKLFLEELIAKSNDDRFKKRVQDILAKY